RPFKLKSNDEEYTADTIIVATGASAKLLGLESESHYMGFGVSACATCDGFFFRDQDVAVVGGGDTAITDALELSQLARKVHVIHRRDQLRAGQVLQQRAFAQPKLEFIWSTVVEAIMGEKLMSGIKLRNVKTGQSSILKVEGIFVAVGFVPNSQQFSNILELDDTGYIVTDETMATSAPGIFAAGDIRRNSPRQITAAVGDGATAAISASKYIQEVGDGAGITNP
ncbi:MAG: FAD-dependent oxidoreductase, partial [Dehalococcoidia bacterium]|nr:FAD-dependent oxidoreductase [Dehalococcoidia bacterium]